MVAPSILVAKTTTPLRVFTLTGGTTITQVGSDLASGTTDATSGNYWISNTVVEFRGALYVLYRGSGATPTIARFNQVTLAWDSVFTTPNTSATAAELCLFVAGTGPARIFFATHQDFVGFRLFYSDDGTSWTNGVIFTSQSGFGKPVLYRNKLYVPTQSNIVVLDPFANTITSAATGFPAFTTPNAGGYCVFRNRLYCVIQGGSSGNDVELYEFTGGMWVSRAVLLSVSAGSGGTDTGHALMPVGSTKMLAVINASADNTNATRGTYAYDLTPTGPTTFTVTNVTNPVVPASLRAPQTTNQRWTGFVDDQTTPGSPAIYLWHLSSPTSGTYSYYEYVDSSTEIGPGSAGPNQDFAFQYNPAGGGERIWDGIGALDIIVTSLTAAPTIGRSRVTVFPSGDTAGRGGNRTSVRLATIAALPANTPAGSGVGKTLTANANGALSVDGTAVVNGDRILVKDEAAPANNGIYVVTDQGSGGTPYVLTRATDFDQASLTEVFAGAWVRVTAGGTLSSTFWQMTQTAAITVDTTALTWAQLTTRFVRLFHSANETPNMLQATLAGTPTGQFATRNGNVIENVIADAATSITFDWDAAADSYVNGAPVTIMPRMGTS